MENQPTQAPAETGCCPRFDVVSWDGTEHQWQDKLFLKRKVRQFLHMPLNFGSVAVSAMKALTDAGATVERAVWLSDEKSLWSMDLLIESAKEVPNEEMVRVSGTFVTKVFEGPYKEIGNWIKEMSRFVEGRGKKIEKLYFWYTTCPKCAKAYGKNYVVLVAKV